MSDGSLDTKSSESLVIKDITSLNTPTPGNTSGRVEVIAEVKVNGKPVGNVWMFPYQLDLTEAVRPGENELEIPVTSLWPNRLIGDEQFPPES